METKLCFKCGIERPITDFYKHPQMKDGRLNKCMSCTKNDVRTKYIKDMEDENYVEKQRKRGREKYKRLGYSTRKSAHSENKGTAKHLKLKGLLLSGHEAHHWNYNYPIDVFILNRRHHKLIHKYLTFNPLLKVFISSEGDLLDTKEKHHNFIRQIFKINNIKSEIRAYNPQEEKINTITLRRTITNAS